MLEDEGENTAWGFSLEKSSGPEVGAQIGLNIQEYKRLDWCQRRWGTTWCVRFKILGGFLLLVRQAWVRVY